MVTTPSGDASADGVRTRCGAPTKRGTLCPLSPLAGVNDGRCVAHSLDPIAVDKRRQAGIAGAVAARVKAQVERGAAARATSPDAVDPETPTLPADATIETRSGRQRLRMAFLRALVGKRLDAKIVDTALRVLLDASRDVDVSAGGDDGLAALQALIAETAAARHE